MTNCKNCGAVLTGGKCEYCGTEYETTTVTHYSDSGIVFCDKDVEVDIANNLIKMGTFLTPNEIREKFDLIKKRGVPNDIW